MAPPAVVEPPDASVVAEAVRRALDEDLGGGSDVTTSATIPPGRAGRAALIAREPCVVAGLDVFEAAFRAVDPAVRVARLIPDGERAEAGATVARVEGPVASILTAERTALNFLQRLSGTATLTRAFVEAAGGAQVRDTRKTTPGLRVLEKYAVRAGGGTNHRMGLHDAILIKDNHIAGAGGVREAVAGARAHAPGMHVEIECETLEQVDEAIAAGADELLLDNMDTATLAEAVRRARGRAATEASGGIRLDTVAAIAATGVDALSVGALTHSAPAIDLALEIEEG